MTTKTSSPDLVDRIVQVLFWIRISAIASFGAALFWLGLHQLRPGFLALGMGLVLSSVAGYFWWHPTKANGTLFMVFAVPGLALAFAGFLL